jgi:succinyl-CoA synthetase beta subunit
VEIEEVARANPEAIKRAALDPFLGLRSYQTLALANGIGLPATYRHGFDAIARGLYDSMLACDGSLAEINPLVITGSGELLALDGKMVLDDNALFRHPDLAQVRDADIETASQETALERQAREAGLSYVGLGGEIGCMVNGAGLAMATMDVVNHFGGTPANFLDIGGGAKAERVMAALQLILADRRVKVVLLNVFGGITRCDEVARGIVAALDEALDEALGEGRPGVPLIVRLAGTNEAEGRAILAASAHGIITANTLAEAAQEAVAATG